MESNEIIRRNEAIARFMGLEWDGEENYWSDPRLGKYSIFTSTELRYNTNWSWLMKAVDRIVIQAGFSHHTIRDDFGDGTFYKVDFNPEHYGSYIHGVRGYGKTMIEATFLAVSEYCLSLEA